MLFTHKRDRMISARVGIAILATLFAQPHCCSAAALKIMPLGDSNTSGPAWARGTYRLQLWKDFGSDINRVEFVGSTGYPLPAELGSKRHEGHSGFTIAAAPTGYGNITDNIPTWLGPNMNPDIILMMIGTNDINYQYRVDEAPARLDHLITLISDLDTGLKPNTYLVVGSLPPINDTNNNFRSTPTDYSANARVDAFNATLPGIVATHIARGERVYFAEINAALTVADIADGLHLTAAGYDKIGDAFYNAILSLPIPEPNTLLLSLITLTFFSYYGRCYLAR
jgi:hypothetical protein